MNERLTHAYRHEPRRYWVAVTVLIGAGACAIELFWGILASRTFGIDPGAAIVPVAVTTCVWIPGGLAAGWIVRGDIRALYHWVTKRADRAEVDRAALLAVALRFPWRFAMAIFTVAAFIAGPIIFAAFALTQPLSFEDLLLALGGGVLGIAYVAAFSYCALEVTLRPLRAELGAAITREQHDRLGAFSLVTKVLLGLAVTAVVLGFSAGVLIADPDSSFWEGTRIVLIAVSVAAIVGGSLAIPLASGALGPIDDLIAGTRAVAAGDLEARVPVTSTDELAELVISFNEMVADLRRAAEEVRASKARIVAASDEARRMVERDLHDGAQQSLMLLNLKLGLIERKLGDPEAIRELVHESRADLDRALDELRDLAHGIYPAVLTSDGLPGALAEAAEQAPLAAEVECNGAGRYPADVEAAVYFCCLEALQNAGKHAGEGAAATVTLEQREGELRFAVADNGSGFDSAEIKGSAGLQNMADRIGALGGELRVQSIPGTGTTVAGVVPLGR